MTEINKGKCRIAAGLAPLMSWLYDAGVLSVCGYDEIVHCTREFFCETFTEYEVKDFDDELKEYIAEYEGVRFFTLVPKEVQ